MMPEHRWLFFACLERVVDGDTVDCIVDLGYRFTIRGRFRLLGVNAPEPRGETKAAGDAATMFVKDWMRWAHGAVLDWPLLLETVQGSMTDSFGRYLVTVYRVSDGANLNADLLAAGHAVEDLR